MLDREASPDDLAELRDFAATRSGVEFYVEPETTATDTTAVAVASDGEWIRRRVGSPVVARELAAELGIPAYDAAIVGYPDTPLPSPRPGPLNVRLVSRPRPTSPSHPARRPAGRCAALLERGCGEVSGAGGDVQAGSRPRRVARW